MSLRVSLVAVATAIEFICSSFFCWEHLQNEALHNIWAKWINLTAQLYPLEDVYISDSIDTLICLGWTVPSILTTGTVLCIYSLFFSSWFFPVVLPVHFFFSSLFTHSFFVHHSHIFALIRTFILISFVFHPDFFALSLSSFASCSDIVFFAR